MSLVNTKEGVSAIQNSRSYYISLGQRILRTEIAVIVAINILMYGLEDLG